MFNIGEYVKILNSNLCGIVIRKTNNCYYIKINDKVIKIKEDSIKKCDKATYELSQNSRDILKKRSSYAHLVERELSNEIMLRHQNVEEALQNLDKFIDNAILNNIGYIKIIHGKHGGILRNAVHEYLKSSPYVKDFRLGDYYEGQFGVTIVHLK